MEKDQKKIECKKERGEIVKDIKAIKGLKHIPSRYKEEMLKLLLHEKESTESPKTNCPFPYDKAYMEVRKNLSHDQQLFMRENIRVTADGSREIIKLKKKLSLLHINVGKKLHTEKFDTIDGRYQDKNKKTGQKGITYFSGDASERECKNNEKHFLADESQIERNKEIIIKKIEELINCFPGETPQKKMLNLIKLFGLENEPGFFDQAGKIWIHSGSVGYVAFSGAFGEEKDGGVYVIRWVGSMPNIGWVSKNSAVPVVVCEPAS